MFQNITVAALQEMHGSSGIALIDVRSEAEAARGIIAGAVPIPLHLLPLKAEELDSETLTVVYCHAGARSAQACAFLADKGFRKVYNLQGGVLAWLRHGLPLGGPAQYGTMPCCSAE